MISVACLNYRLRSSLMTTTDVFNKEKAKAAKAFKKKNYNLHCLLSTPLRPLRFITT